LLLLYLLLITYLYKLLLINYCNYY